MMKLVLNKSARRARVRHGHPWAFVNELENVPGTEWDGRALPLEDFNGHHIGMGVYNSRSKIAWRKYSDGSDAWDRQHFSMAIEKADLSREDEPFRRLVWSEADRLPGLVVDQFDDVLVVQALTKAVDDSMDAIVELLQQRFDPREILLRNDAPSRRFEGLELHRRTVSGKPLEPFWAQIYNVWYYLDLENLQKTGFYLDQRHEHFKVSTMSPDWRVLDAFCNQGAFALNCALAGAREVIAIDSSVDAIRLGKMNAEKNEVDIDFRCDNVFDYFTANKDQRFDMIILDPPSFAPSRKTLKGAVKGYKELHVRSFRSLNPGGILATYCCSHHVSRELFRTIVEDAASDTRKSVQVLYETGQPIDHPVMLNFPESEYLKGFILRMG